MRGLRALCAALLLVACTLGVPLHSATAHGMAHGAGVTMLHSAHVDDHARGKHCPDCPSKAGPGALCQMVCAAAVAVLGPPLLPLGTRLAYTVRFTAGPPASAQGVATAPDPFPPRPSRIA